MKSGMKKIYRKTAIALTMSLLISGVSPLAGLAKMYYETPIGSDNLGDYDLATLPDAEVKVDIDDDSRELTTDDLENRDGYKINFGVSVDFDLSGLATPDDASPSDWDEDIWERQILSEISLSEYISEESKDVADILGLDVKLEDASYALLVTASKAADLAPGETYIVKIGIDVDTDSVTSYENEKITGIGDEIILYITALEDNPGKPIVGKYKFFDGDEDGMLEVKVNHTLKLPFSFENESILKVDFEQEKSSIYYDVEYNGDNKELIIKGKKASYIRNYITSREASPVSITVETDKSIYTGKEYIYVDYFDSIPEYWRFDDLKLQKGKTVNIPLPVIQGAKLLDYTTILVDWWGEDGNYKEFDNPDEILEAKFSKDYKYLILTAKQELANIRVRAQIVTDDYTCYRVASYKVSTGGEDLEGMYIPAQNPTWMVGDAGRNGKDYPGLATWDSNAISEEDKEAVVQVYSRVYRDGKYLGYFNSKSYRELMDLKRLFVEEGEYTFQTVFSKDDSRPDKIPDQYWSEYSEPYQYNPPAKKVSTPQNLKWNADGSMTWDNVAETYESLSNHRYVGFIYRVNYGEDGDTYERLATYFVTPTNYMDPVDLEPGYSYVFNVVAYGDLINYANSDPSDYSAPLLTGTVVEQSDKLINALKDGDVKANIENTELSIDERDNLKLGIQTDATVAENYGDLEERYKQSKKSAGENVDFEINAEGVADKDKIKVIGGVLNGAAGVAFEKPSDEVLSNTNVSKYRRKSAINISLTGNLADELKYPVLITMPVPSGIHPAKLIIVHIRHDGTPEIIRPRINGDGTASFAVTTFSTFFFVDETSTGSSSSGGSGGGGGGSSSGVSSLAGTTTIDAKKGRVNSVTGIIIGTGDGYSKWISEVPQGQEEGAGVRWKLQYADGTFATGTYLMDEEGNLVQDAAGSLIEQPLWELIGGAWYAFGADGYAKSGMMFDPALNGWFYLDINSGMKTGWQQIEEKWYYFNPMPDGTRGKMAVSTTVDGYTIDENGVRVQ